jgi:hypothetical protein
MKSGLIVAAMFAAVAFALGIRGFDAVAGGCAENCLAHYANVVWRTLALFVFETDMGERYAADWHLVLARLLAPAATGIALYELIARYISQIVAMMALRNMRRHTVIIGNGHVGRAFLDSRDAGHAAAVVDLAEAGYVAGTPARARKDEARSFLGDARDAATLRSVAAEHARRVVIATGNDTVNLEILRTLLANRRFDLGDRDEPLDVLVRVEQQALVRQLEREDRFAHWSGTGARGRRLRRAEITAFAPAKVAAQRFFAEHPLVDLADLRAQSRLHLVCIGWSDFMFEFLEQLARLSPYRAFGHPRVDFFVRRPDAVRSFLAAVQPALLASGADAIAELTLYDLDDESGIPSNRQMRLVEPDGTATVSGIVVSLASDEATAAASVAVRERSAVEGRWNAPVFAHLDYDSALSDYLQEDSVRSDAADSIVPVGVVGWCCTVDAIRGAREDMARALHESYVRHRRGEGASAAGDDSLAAWPELRQTYRISNRRAADHIAIKLLSTGHVFEPGSGVRLASPQDGRFEGAELEQLAALEHRSWQIDRRLDGWRPGKVRDNRRRINPALGVAYSGLSEAVKEYDREQIRVVGAMLAEARTGAVARRDLPVGLIGHNQVSAADKRWLVEAVEPKLDALIARFPGRHVSLVTPLAPGSDTILAEAALAALAAAGVPHRLVVVRTLPREAVLADFLEVLGSGGEWRLAPRSADPAGDDATMLAGHLDNVMRSAPRAIVANLIPAGSHLGDWYGDVEMRRDAYRRANAYVVARTRALIAFCDPARKARPGGTAEAVGWAGGAPIPDRFADVMKGGSCGPPELIVLSPPGEAGVAAPSGAGPAADERVAGSAPPDARRRRR